MARNTSLAELVETITDAAQALEKWHAQQDGIRTLNAARRIASAAASIVARLNSFEDAEIAQWTAAVDRAVARREE